jgi:hypothetical protein
MVYPLNLQDGSERSWVVDLVGVGLADLFGSERAVVMDDFVDYPLMRSGRTETLLADMGCTSSVASRRMLSVIRS